MGKAKLIFVVMKRFLVFVLVVFTLTATGQDYVRKRVVTEEGIPLSFSTVILKPTNKGVITNEDGFFNLSKSDIAQADSIFISHLGFKEERIKADQLLDIPIIVLAESVNKLQQVSVLSNKEKVWAETIFDSFQKRRNASLENEETGRITIRSYENAFPVEVLEGEASIDLDNTGVPGRLDYTYLTTRLDTNNQPRFFSIHTAFLIENFNPFERSEVSPWPLHPGRLGKRSIVKDFEIELLTYHPEQGVSEYQLTSKNSSFLSAEIWLRESDNEILHYRVFGEARENVPVISLAENTTIRNFSVDLEFDFGTPTGRLNYLTWNYSFLLDGIKMKSWIKLLMRDEKSIEPIFIYDERYHDYAMAAMLPQDNRDLQEEFERNRSNKDREALGNLQNENFSLASSIVFWNRDTPFDSEQIPKKYVTRNGRKEVAQRSDVALIADRFNLKFNSIVYKNAQGKYEEITFFDQVKSSSIAVDRPELELLINLVFDEYAYAASRIAKSSNEANLEQVRDTERAEIDLNKDRLFTNSQAGNNLRFLLERNYANYELHGVDRFYQIHKEALDSPLFEGFHKHLDPSIPEDLALAYMLVGDEAASMRILKTIYNDSGKATYLKALNLYYKDDCYDYREMLSRAEKEGFTVPELARTLCR